MKNNIKRIAILALSGMLAAGSMAGCSKGVDGTKTVVTVNDEEIKLGTVNLALRYRQAQMIQTYDAYFGGSDGIWSKVIDQESGRTYGEETVRNTLDQIIDMVVLRQHASEYEVTLSEEDQAAITETAGNFIEANDEATLVKLGVDQDQVEELLELYCYNAKMYEPIAADADMEVSDEEAAQTGVTFVEVAPMIDSEESAEEAAETEDASEEDVQAKAQQILDEILATADADMNAIAKGVDENLSARTTHFTTNLGGDEEDSSGVPEVVQERVRSLTDGEIAGELVEEYGTYYIVRLDAAFDAEATESQKTTIQNERKQELYNETLEQWREESEITEQDKALETLEVKDNDRYSFKLEETEAPEEETGEVAEEATTADESAEDENVADEVAGEEATGDEAAE